MTCKANKYFNITFKIKFYNFLMFCSFTNFVKLNVILQHVEGMNKHS